MTRTMSTSTRERTLFFFEKPSAMRQLQRFFKSPDTVCVAAEGHLLSAEEPGTVRAEWKPWRFETLPIVLDAIPVRAGRNRSGQSHGPKLDAIRQALRGADRVVIATDPGREGSMIAWEVLEHLGWRGRIDRLKLGALDDLSIRRAFAAMAKEPDSGARDYAAYLEALCRQYEDYHLGLNGTRAISLRLRPAAFREPWRFGGVQTPTLAILADLEGRIRAFEPRDFFKVGLPVVSRGGAKLTLWHAPKERIFDPEVAGAIREAAARWSGRLAVEGKDVRRPPPKLFSKDTLARRCAKRFGWDPQHTAKLAQELYDKGYLTYPAHRIGAPAGEPEGRRRRGGVGGRLGPGRLRAPDAGGGRPRVPQRAEGALRQGPRRAPRHRAAAQGAGGRRTRARAGARSRAAVGARRQGLFGRPHAGRHRRPHDGVGRGRHAARVQALRRHGQRRARARLARHLRRRGGGGGRHGPGPGQGRRRRGRSAACLPSATARRRRPPGPMSPRPSPSRPAASRAASCPW